MIKIQHMFSFQDMIYYDFRVDPNDPASADFFYVYRGSGEIYLRQPLIGRPQDSFRVMQYSNCIRLSKAILNPKI